MVAGFDVAGLVDVEVLQVVELGALLDDEVLQVVVDGFEAATCTAPMASRPSTALIEKRILARRVSSTADGCQECSRPPRNESRMRRTRNDQHDGPAASTSTDRYISHRRRLMFFLQCRQE